MRARLAASPLRLLPYKFMAFLAVLGPGFITANVDNDPGGILTYSQAGAKYGYALLWTVIPTTVALIVVQEMAARMGAITGKGLSDLIREEFGLRITFFTITVLGLADFGNIAAEFAGLASGLGIFGVSKYIAVPAGGLLVWGAVVHGSYRPVERALLLLSFIYFTYPISAFLAHPDWRMAIHDTLIPQFSKDPGYVVMIVGLIGTTITQWMQFYLQALCSRERHIQAKFQSVPCGCDFRMHCHRRHCVFHRDSVRSDNFSFGPSRVFRRGPTPQERWRHSLESLLRCCLPSGW